MDELDTLEPGTDAPLSEDEILMVAGSLADAWSCVRQAADDELADYLEGLRNAIAEAVEAKLRELAPRSLPLEEETLQVLYSVAEAATETFLSANTKKVVDSSSANV